MSIIRINDGRERVIIVDVTDAPVRWQQWSAHDDNYDGAEDSRTRSHVGYGMTPLDAITDYLENYGDE